MAGLEQKPIRRTCPEPDDHGGTCGAEHLGTIDTCPDHLLALADAFWATMGMATPVIGQRPQSVSPPATPQPKKRRNRPSRKRRAKGNDHG